MIRYHYISLKNARIDSEDDWIKFYDWCEDRFENKWNFNPTGLILRVNEEFDLTELKLTWLL